MKARMYKSDEFVYYATETDKGSYNVFSTDTNTMESEDINWLFNAKSFDSLEEAQEKLVKRAQVQGWEEMTDEEIAEFEAQVENLPDDNEEDSELAVIEVEDTDGFDAEVSPAIPTGTKVSILDEAFEDILDDIDRKLNAALKISAASNESFALTVKMVFDPTNGEYKIEHTTGFQFEPVKVQDKRKLAHVVPIVLDENGDPIIPEDREKQMNFNDYEPGATVTTDEYGVVEKVEFDEGFDLDPMSEEDGEGGNNVDFCSENNCEFHGAIDGSCNFDIDMSNEELLSFSSEIREAHDQLGCTSKEIVKAYNKLNEEEDDDE